ncbi:transaldolase [uncultured Draconibacterium sp.]|uniref:transaldolase n=1 Tax=uncultured Draconibacterium sp. TaxID=1573823 RepID=UPI0029C7F406|nr:transaldolase [uncultured Draconibacterium sp.]
MEKFDKLLEYGQSYWLDNLSREIITNGNLENRIENEGLRGITSNPKIFMNAISSGDLYDEQVKKLAGNGKKTEDIYESLVVQDIQKACDMLRPVFDASNGEDGFVSLEVSPYLARETEKTKEEARRLYKEVDRPNCMIKIPGTKEGIPAIEEMLYEGININITLLFSVESYEAVAKAYLNALERRAEEGKPIDKIASVASFFLSRIDVLVDKMLLNDIIPQLEGDKKIVAGNLLGSTAIASAKIAYQRFLKLFSGERWEKLAAKGARVQRPLWASTSNKTEAYCNTRYVEPLIGRHTVNTMPGETIEAFKEYGHLFPNTVQQNVDDAYRVFDDLKKVGINLDEVTRQLVEEGIEKFIEPFNELLETVEEEAK